MKKVDLIFIVISMLVALCGYLTTNIIYIAIGIFVIYVLYYFVLIRKRIAKYFKRIEVCHGCYHFVNSFIITMSVKESYEEAYQNGLRLAPKSLLNETSEIENMTILERITFLRSYFNLAIYKMFLNIIQLYQDQGGSILKMSDSLLRECTRVEKSIKESSSISNRHLAEFGVLWILSFFILVFLRFALRQFYEQMTSSIYVVIFITGFYLIFLISLHLFMLRYTQMPVKEDVIDV